MRRGAVVLLQPDHLRPLEILLEAQDVAHLGPAPAIDRLVVVAHAADVAMPAGQEPQPEILRDVGVLILVHEDVAEPAAVLREDVLVLLEHVDDVQEQVSEIAGVQRQQPVLVGAVERHPLAVEGLRLVRGDLLRCPGAVLPVVDDAVQHARGPALLVDVGGEDELLEQPVLVVAVEDGEVRAQMQVARLAVHRHLPADEFGVPPQQLDADRMEGAEPRHPLDDAAGPAPTRHPPQPLLHLARRLVGEGHGKDLVRPCLSGRHQVGDSRSQRPRLAGSRPREHQHGPVERLDRLQLRGVQPVEIGRRPGGHGAGGEARGEHRVGIVEIIHGERIERGSRRGNPVFTICSKVRVSRLRPPHAVAAFQRCPARSRAPAGMPFCRTITQYRRNRGPGRGRHPPPRSRGRGATEPSPRDFAFGPRLGSGLRTRPRGRRPCRPNLAHPSCPRAMDGRGPGPTCAP